MGHEPYKVKKGECISSIAFQRGFFRETIWGDSLNAELAKKRVDDGNVLAENDVLQIPERQPAWRQYDVDSHHRFLRKGAAEKLILQFKLNGEPRSKAQYVLDIDGVVRDGETDGNGVLDVWIPSNAKGGKVRFLVTGEEYVLQLGSLAPASTVSGAKARLKNLGLYTGEINDVMDPAFETALRGFQRLYKVDTEGGLNEATQAKLRALHGS